MNITFIIIQTILGFAIISLLMDAVDRYSTQFSLWRRIIMSTFASTILMTTFARFTPHQIEPWLYLFSRTALLLLVGSFTGYGLFFKVWGAIKDIVRKD